MFLSYFLRRERKAEDAGANGDDDDEGPEKAGGDWVRGTAWGCL